MCVGFLDVITAMFPPFPSPAFVPDYTGYDLDQQGYDWYAIEKDVSQTPSEALKSVKS